MSGSNWTCLFPGRNELETIFNTASKKKSLTEKERKKKEKEKKGKMQIYCHFSGS